ncbi:IQ domain-containing protein isoform 3 [Schistosoma japonicum]|uniref:IQ domain-containing protein isoform 3 n=1 Tax=Schistosoma japonicum TaxID=6182 RepID=A0A4Z2D4Z2_SCHJA|nr:IQ domain-containing protein isoform 3 [Schistosoma japonicum]
MSKNTLWDGILSDSQLEKYGLIPEEVYKSTILNCDSFQTIQSFKLSPENSCDDYYQQSIDDVLMKPYSDYAKTCTPKEYLTRFIFPTLLPAMEAMLEQAKRGRCFEKKRFGFNGLDFLTFYLYKNNVYNTKDDNRENIQNLSNIPWINEEWQKNPRKPLPFSLQWTDEEAAIKLQSYWRGYLVSLKSKSKTIFIRFNTNEFS